MGNNPAGLAWINGWWGLYLETLLRCATAREGRGEGVNVEPMFGYCTYKKSYREKGGKKKKCNHRFFS